MFDKNFNYSGYEEDEYYQENIPNEKPIQKLYLRWKNRDDHELVQITGAEFFALVNSPEAKGRYFVVDADPYHETDTLVYEVTHEQYEAEHKRRTLNYQLKSDIEALNDKVLSVPCLGTKSNRRKPPLVYNTLSFDAPIEDNEDECSSLNEIVADPDSIFEDQVLIEMIVEKALDCLDPDEKDFINVMFFKYGRTLSEREIEKCLGIPQTTVNRKKNKIFKKIRKNVGQKGQMFC